jgi:biopolymer transport protein ExbB/TolQ
MNLALAIWALTAILGSAGGTRSGIENRINAILFWGAFGAGVGLLGQATGIYLALRAVGSAPEISPPIVMEGFAISFVTTIVGLIFFLVSALVWFALRAIHRREMQTAAAV